MILINACYHSTPLKHFHESHKRVFYTLHAQTGSLCTKMDYRKIYHRSKDDHEIHISVIILPFISFYCKQIRSGNKEGVLVAVCETRDT